MLRFMDYRTTQTLTVAVHSAYDVNGRTWTLISTAGGTDIVVSPFGDEHIDVTGWSLDDAGPFAITVPYQLQLDSFITFVLAKVEESLI